MQHWFNLMELVDRDSTATTSSIVRLAGVFIARQLKPQSLSGGDEVNSPILLEIDRLALNLDDRRRTRE